MSVLLSAIFLSLTSHLAHSSVLRNENTVHNGHLKYVPKVTGEPDVTGYTGSYFFMHIPKAGGASMEAELERITSKAKSRLVYFYPPGTFETVHDQDLFPDGQPRVITMFRSPAAHVISMYQHCMTADIHAKSAHLMPSFDEWIGNYSAALLNYKASRVDRIKDYKCFNPVNAQSYRMNGHRLTELHVFGILEQFDTSICLAAEAIRGKLPLNCRCDYYKPNQYTHKSHNVAHTLTEATLTSQQKQIIHTITLEDEILVANAHKLFLLRVAEIEKKYGVSLPMHCSPNASS